MKPVPTTTSQETPWVSLAIFAWNEEEALGRVLESLFAQTLFAELARRGRVAEVLCVLNGCTDGTAATARRFFLSQSQQPRSPWVRCDVCDLPERGKLNAWNQFVHHLSSRDAQYLVMMDADIIIHEPETLWNLIATLEQDAKASVAVDRPCKDIGFKNRRSWRERLSLQAATITQSAAAQLCAQLYCIRAEIARNIYFPKDLPACEDGFIKALVCTDFLEHPPVPARIRLAPKAAHTFEAYTSPRALLKNQKRQIIGQTVVHILIDQYLRGLPSNDRRSMAATLKRLEAQDPAWLKKLIASHVAASTRFWKVCPGYVGNSLRRWCRLPPRTRPTAFPSALAHFGMALLASYLAHRALKSGCVDYWPRAERAATRRAITPGIPLVVPDPVSTKNS